MFDVPVRDRWAERRDATRAELVAAAWELARRDGLAALSLRDLAQRVGLRAPSLYSYFDSKNAIYDAMFAQAAREHLEAVHAVPTTGEPHTDLRALIHGFLRFCTADPSRYQLLFQRTVPGFEPSAESFAAAEEALAAVRGRLVRLGVADPAALDLATALATGLAGQQVANDPGGDRWTRLVDDACRMFLAHYLPRRRTTRRGRA